MNTDSLRRQLYRLFTLLGQGAHTEANNWLGLTDARSCREQLQAGEYRNLMATLAQLRHADPHRYGLCLVALADWPGRPAFLDQWVSAMETVAESWLVRGSHALRWALDSHEPSLDHAQGIFAMHQFFARLEQAEADLQRALALAPENPEVLAQRIAVAAALGLPREALHERFQALCEQDPGHYPGHSQMLVGLCRHPEANQAQALAFVHRVCDGVDDGSPLLALVPQVYIEDWALTLYHSDPARAKAALAGSDASGEIHAAFQRLFAAPGYQRTVLEPVLAGHFSVAFYLLEDRGGVQQAIAMIGDYAASYPWNHLCRRPMELIYPGYAIDRVREYASGFPF